MRGISRCTPPVLFLQLVCDLQSPCAGSMRRFAFAENRTLLDRSVFKCYPRKRHPPLSPPPTLMSPSYRRLRTSILLPSSTTANDAPTARSWAPVLWR